MQNQKEPSKNPEDEAMELIRFVSEHKLDKDPRIKALIRSLAANPDNTNRKRQLRRLIKPYLVKRALTPDPFLPGPEADEVNGKIKLGLSHPNSAGFGLQPEELMQGTLIIGRPGAGKTTFTYNLIEQANQLGMHSLVLDIKKDYRHLIRKLPNTLVFRADSKEFKWNPLEQPEAVDRVSHITNFADITSEAHAIYDGTNNYIVQHLDWLFKKNPQATLFDLYNVIRHDRPALISRTSRYKESAENRLASILVKMGSAFRHKRGYRIEKLIDDYNIVIELDNLGSKGCIYISSLILSHIFQYRIANNLRGIKQKPALVIIDEANEIFDKNLERKLGGLTLVSMAREAREFQLGIVSSCQVPDAISDTVKNVYTRVLLNLPEGANLKNMALSMGLVKEQQELNFALETGQAIVRLAGRYFKPFLVQIPAYEIQKDVSNKEVQKHMEKFIPELGVEEPEPEIETVKVTEKEQQKLKVEEKSFLLDIYNRPFLNLTERYKVFKLSGYKGNKLKEQLIDKKRFCEIIEINLGGRGKTSKFLSFENAGFEAIGMPRKNKIHRSNFEHSFWQDRIHKHFSKQHKTFMERDIRGKHVDVAVETDKGIIAIEIAMTPAYERNNILKDLKAGCIKVIIGCRDKKVLEEVNSIIAGLDPEKQDKARAYLLPEILKVDLSHV